MRSLHPSVAAGTRVAYTIPESRPAVRANSLYAWLVPDIRLGVAFAALVYLFLLFGGATALFRDSDAGWHIRNGEQILATFQLPHTDPYSFSKAGQPWVSWEWLADVLTGAVHQAWGLPGVAWIYGLAIAASVWLWFRLNWIAGGNFVFACLFASPMLSTTNLHWLARPHVFGWIFLLLAVGFCERLPQSRLTAGRLAAIALFSALWANVHASFFLLPVVALIYAAGNGLLHLIWIDNRPKQSAAYLAVAAAAFAGTLCNPYGWELHRHVVEYLMNAPLLDRIGEFQTFNFHAEGAGQIMIGLGLACAGGFAALATRRPERFLLSVVFIAMALRNARTLPVAALVLLPLANGSITDVLRMANVRFRKTLDKFLDYSDSLRRLDMGFSGLALAPIAAVLLLFGLRTPFAQAHTGFPRDQFPVAAAEEIEKLPAHARLFAPDKFGGYLIYRFRGERKVFFDGRSDFYGAAFLKNYGRMVQVRPGWQTGWERWNFTHALLPADYSLIPALEAQGWRKIYRDETVVLLESLRK